MCGIRVVSHSQRIHTGAIRRGNGSPWLTSQQGFHPKTLGRDCLDSFQPEPLIRPTFSEDRVHGLGRMDGGTEAHSSLLL